LSFSWAYVVFEHKLEVPLQFPGAELPNIPVIGLKNAIGARNQSLPSQYKGLLSVILFRTALYILGYDGGLGTGFSIILYWNYQDYTWIIMWR
jgi:hypothetical protein